MSNTVLVTGSSAILGKEIARVFAENKYNIILHGRDKQRLYSVFEELHSLGGEVCYVQGDLKDKTTIDSLLKTAVEKDISVLVNNAAIPCPGLPIEKLSNRQIDEILSINLIAPITLSKKIYEFFKLKNEGAIININSIISLEPKKFRTISSAAKRGLAGFTNSLRIEAQDYNIQVMGIYLSRVKTQPEFTYGMEPRQVALKIFDNFKNQKIDELIIDGRPQEYRPRS